MASFLAYPNWVLALKQLQPTFRPQYTDKKARGKDKQQNREMSAKFSSSQDILPNVRQIR
jgi:hypothetical protein